jgi:hypothetical protein
MHSVNKTAAIIISCFVLALVFLAPPLIHGDEWNLATRFTVNHPFEVPNLVLQPNTPYVIRLYDSPAERHVVQIYNEDQTKMLTMFMGVSDERMQAADKTVFTFIETAPGYPLPMKEWFYPGRLHGLEFVYPKDQAMEIARHAREPILSADAGDLHKLASIRVEAIGPIGEARPTTTQTAEVTKSEEAPVTEEKPSVAENTQPEVDQENAAEQENLDNSQQIAQNDNDSNLKSEEPEVQREKPAEPETPAVTEESNNNEELPRTAGELPLIALIGALCLGAGLGLKVLSAKS